MRGDLLRDVRQLLVRALRLRRAAVALVFLVGVTGCRGSSVDRTHGPALVDREAARTPTCVARPFARPGVPPPRINGQVCEVR